MSNHSIPLVSLSSEHKSLMEEISEIQGWWRAHKDRDDFNFGEMGRRVMDLRRVLSSHFTGKEQSGYLREAAKRQPHYVDSVAELLRQHNTFLEELSTLADRLASGVVHYGNDTNEPHRELSDVIERLARHEELESQILAAALNAD